jgi:hypothetical protein
LDCQPGDLLEWTAEQATIRDRPARKAAGG